MATLASLVVKIGADVSGLVSGTQTGSAAVMRMGQNIQRAGDNIAGIGRKLTYGVTLPIVGLGYKAITAASDFEKSMNTMAAVAGVPQRQIKTLRDLALEMGAKTVFSAQEAGDAMVELSKGGLSVAQIRAGSLANTLDLAAAADMGLAESAVIVSQAMNTFGLSGKDSMQIVDALAGAANKSSADMDDLSLALSQGGAAAARFGLTVQETAGMLALLADRGIRGSDAGTLLKSQLRTLVPITDKAREKMKELGLDFFDAQGRFIGLAGMAAELKREMGGLTQEQRELAINQLFGADASRLAGILAKEGAAGLREYVAGASEAGTASEVATARMKGLPGALEQLRGSIETTMITFGKAIAPAVKDVAKFLTEWANRFGALPKPVQQTIAKILLMLALLGPGLFILGKFIKTFGMLIEWIGLAGKAFKALKTAYMGFQAAAALGGTTISGVFGPLKMLWALIAAHPFIAIGVAVVALALLIWKNWDSIKSFLIATWNFIKTTAAAIWQGLVGFFKTVGENISNVFKTVWEAITGFLSGVWNGIKEIASRIWNNEIVSEFRKTVAVWMNIFKAGWAIITTIFRVAFAAIKAVATVVFNALKAYFTVVLNVYKTIFVTTWNVIKSILLGIWNVLKAAATTVFSAVKTVITTVWNAVKTVTMAVWNSIKGLLQATWNIIKAVVSGAINFVKNIIIAVLRALRGDWAGAWESIKAALATAWNTMKTVVSTAIGAVVRFMAELPGRILRALGDLGQLLIEAGKDLIRGLINGIKAMVGAAVNAVKGAISGVINGAKSLLGIGSPSKVFYKIGQDTLAGLVNALGRTAKLDRAMERMVNRIEKHLKGKVRRAFMAEVSALSHEIDKAEKHLERLQNKSQEVADRIRSGFDNIAGDIIGDFKNLDLNIYQQVADEEGNLTDVIVGQKDAASEITSMLAERAKTAQEFAGLLQSLEQRGVARDLLMDIAESGDVAFARAMASATDSQIQDINNSLQQIDKFRADITHKFQTSFFGEQIETAAKNLADLSKQAIELGKQIEKAVQLAIEAEKAKAAAEKAAEAAKEAEGKAAQSAAKAAAEAAKAASSAAAAAASKAMPSDDKKHGKGGKGGNKKVADAGNKVSGGTAVANNYKIDKVEIPAKDLKEMRTVDDFFKRIGQAARSGAGKEN